MLKLGKFSFIALIVSLLLNAYFLLKEILPKDVNVKQKEVVVVRVVDADTFDSEDEERIRLAGADSPEYPKGCLSEAAKQRLIALIAGKKVQLEVVEKDSFGRLVAFVFSNGLFVDKALVEEGLAKATSASHPEHGVSLLQAQDTAQKAERGIWSKLCQGPKDASCLIKGNYRRDRKTRVYHLLECFNYDKIVVNEQKGDRWFCNEEEAEAAGFRKSEDCPKN